MTRMRDKIQQIDQFLNELHGIVPSTIEEYAENLEKKAACERYIEKVVEGITDLAFLLIKSKKLKIPQDDSGAFDILQEGGLIDAALAKKLKSAKGMKNIIAHQYGDIDDAIVFESLSNQLERDVREFIAVVRKLR